MTRPSYGRLPDGENTPTEILASTAGLEKIGIMLDNNTIAVAASLTTNLTGANNDFVVTAKQAGVIGNHIEVALVDPAGNDQALAVTVADGVITVSLATGPAGAITSTAANVIAAINGNADAKKLVVASLKAANDGTGVVTALAAANLTGGVDAGAPATIAKGTVMGRVTATGLYKAYDDSASDGTEVALGVLSDAFDVSTADQNDVRLAANMYIHGTFIEAALIGLDANAKTDLGARTIGAVVTF